MTTTDVLLVALAVLAFGVVAGRVEGTPITMPMLFAGAGLLLGPSLLGVLELELGGEVVSVLAEATLVLVLFTDASRIDLGKVADEHGIATRLLLVGLPLAALVGTGAAWLLFPGIPLVAAALLAVTLAPTDAALGQSFVDNASVPQRIRQTLNVESGLNDGLALPFLALVLDLAQERADGFWPFVGLLAQAIGVGTLVGVVAGGLGGRLVTTCVARGWTTPSTQRLSTIALAAVAYAGAESLGGNGFVAAFVAGVTLGTVARSLLSGTSEFAEADGQLLTLLTFLLFGAVVAGPVLADTTWRVVGYAVVSLLVVRPLATGICLLGAGLAPRTVAFVGWAGPRGLASIVYAVLVLESGTEGADTVFTVAAWTILLSILLHGLTAAPLSERYGTFVAQLPSEAPERRPVTDLPVRLPPRWARHHDGG
jgi:sodium/hydrogen antiporter